MKTPYDPVVRIGKRDVERLRDALRQEMVRVSGLVHEAAKLAQHVREECRLAELDATLRTDGWVRARKAQAEQIAQQRVDAETGLNQLREQALTAYGKLRAAEKTASAYLDKARAEAERKAQAEADDYDTARRLLKSKRRERLTRSIGAQEQADAA
ncbi:hypothetical protein [Sphingobium fluviale]|uniref:Flagellar export protein FliJ n=1 Tax=Sphingobium fluviale TaxID=2506423 RepID=A0A4Q1KHZ4_9SPHN|nr:hypothetical protein [Sphingobium fluviale]RXR28749.1 hypothetical protein EQG66_08475 [Sphingobium fluviale]